MPPCIHLRARLRTAWSLGLPEARGLAGGAARTGACERAGRGGGADCGTACMLSSREMSRWSPLEAGAGADAPCMRARTWQMWKRESAEYDSRYWGLSSFPPKHGRRKQWAHSLSAQNPTSSAFPPCKITRTHAEVRATQHATQTNQHTRTLAPTRTLFCRAAAAAAA